MLMMQRSFLSLPLLHLITPVRSLTPLASSTRKPLISTLPRTKAIASFTLALCLLLSMDSALVLLPQLFLTLPSLMESLSGGCGRSQQRLKMCIQD
uniref:Uncharacterized protein n=1 Tax=Brassica oleracea TaxID=3712 RepID=A0A3P6E8E0_BRAOL|nr:unnamed protein product [Brassica oleracea]